jgi:predicted nuclease of restriction endonuclease-like (RecB) superfamily
VDKWITSDISNTLEHPKDKFYTPKTLQKRWHIVEKTKRILLWRKTLSSSQKRLVKMNGISLH